MRRRPQNLHLFGIPLSGFDAVMAAYPCRNGEVKPVGGQCFLPSASTVVRPVLVNDRVTMSDYGQVQTRDFLEPDGQGYIRWRTETSPVGSDARAVTYKPFQIGQVQPPIYAEGEGGTTSKALVRVVAAAISPAAAASLPPPPPRTVVPAATKVGTAPLTLSTQQAQAQAPSAVQADLFGLSWQTWAMMSAAGAVAYLAFGRRA